MSLDSLKTSSRAWSCSTLRDGADYVLKQAQELHDEEASLEKLIQDCYHHVLLQYHHVILKRQCFTLSNGYCPLVTPKRYLCCASLVSVFAAGTERKE